MKQKYVLLLLVLFSYTTYSQETYWAGVETVSIEPGDDFFSLPLQGYGNPPEGRFTIEWVKKGMLQNSKSIAGSDNGLYSLMPNGNLWKADTKQAIIEWKYVGTTNTVFRLAGDEPNSFKMIAGTAGKLYAISLNNRLSVYNTQQSPMEWTVMGKTADAIALAAWKDKLYIASSGGELFEGQVNGQDVSWEKTGTLQPGTISMAAYDGRLYLLTSSQRIWEGVISGGKIAWTEIAYINGSTYTNTLSQITVVGNQLWAGSLDQNLYTSQHATRGDLTVRALTVKSREKTIALVGMDLTAIDYSFGLEIKNEIRKETGIPADAVMLNVSHTHFSPVSKVWYAFGDFGYPDRRYLEKVKNATVLAVKNAMASMEPSKLYFGRTSTYIGKNRSLRGEDARLYDSDVDILKVETPEGKLKTILFMAACHPVFPYSGKNRYTNSANYPGIARAVIEENLKCKNTIFFQACGGDINPRTDNDQTLGTILAYDVLKCLEKPMQAIIGKIMCSMDSLMVPVDVWSKEKIIAFKNENSHKTGDIEAEKNIRWANKMLNDYEQHQLKTTMPVYIQTIDIGNWKLIGLSRESVSEYSLAIKQLWPRKMVSVAGYTNDVSSYLPTAKHIETNTYEGVGSFFWYGEIATFPMNIFDLVIDKIKK